MAFASTSNGGLGSPPGSAQKGCAKSKGATTYEMQETENGSPGPEKRRYSAPNSRAKSRLTTATYHLP